MKRDIVSGLGRIRYNLDMNYDAWSSHFGGEGRGKQKSPGEVRIDRNERRVLLLSLHEKYVSLMSNLSAVQKRTALQLIPSEVSLSLQKVYGRVSASWEELDAIEQCLKKLDEKFFVPLR